MLESLFPHKARLWNSLPIKCFLLIYNLNGFQLNNFEKAYLVFKEALKDLFCLWKSHAPFLRLLVLLYSISSHSIKFESYDALMSIDTQVEYTFMNILVRSQT